MGYKVYDFFITDLNPFELTNEVRPLLNNIFLKKFAKYAQRLKENITENDVLFKDLEDIEINSFCCESKKIRKGYVDSDFYTYIELLYKCPTVTFSKYDFGFEFIMIEGPENTTVCKVFSQDPDYLKALEECDFLKDFSYWTTTDPDESISEEEWMKREKFWTQRKDSPIDEGISFSHPSKLKTLLHFRHHKE